MVHKIDEAKLSDATVVKYAAIQIQFLKYLEKNYVNSVKVDMNNIKIPNKPLTKEEVLTFIGSIVFNKNGSLKSYDTIRGYLASIKDLYNNSENKVDRKRIDYEEALNHAKMLKIDQDLSIRINKFAGAYATIVTKMCKGKFVRYNYVFE